MSKKIQWQQWCRCMETDVTEDERDGDIDKHRSNERDNTASFNEFLEVTEEKRERINNDRNWGRLEKFNFINTKRK